MEEFRFGDIVNTSYPKLEIERDFPDKILRAAQFAPFAALTGHDDAIAETARLTEEKPLISGDVKEELNRRLTILAGNLENSPEIEVTYFVPDEKKSGGRSITRRGVVKAIRSYDRMLVLGDGTGIPFSDILFIDGELFFDIY